MVALKRLVPASWQRAAEGYTRSTDARTGSFSASLASPPLNAAVMLQNSVSDGGLPGITPGDTPLLSFWAKGFAGTTGNVLFSLRYLAAGGGILATSGNQFFQGAINPSTWTEITYNLGVVPAGATSAFIEFSQGIGPINGVDLLAGTVLIDDVVLLGEAIPEPSSLALLGLGGLALVARRRRHA
jgi:PEP-CTERM motif